MTYAERKLRQAVAITDRVIKQRGGRGWPDPEERELLHEAIGEVRAIVEELERILERSEHARKGRTTDSSAICAKLKCQHRAYNHEDPISALGKCRYWGCRCPRFGPAENSSLPRLRRAPPNAAVYSSGAPVWFPPDAQPKADEQPRIPHERNEIKEEMARLRQERLKRREERLQRVGSSNTS